MDVRTNEPAATTRYRAELANAPLAFLDFPVSLRHARTFTDGLTVREVATGVHVERKRTERVVRPSIVGGVTRL